jgi:two-component system, OmpR family, response regulator
MSSNPHILVVDDDPEICGLLQDYLTDQGYAVSIAHSGADMQSVMAQSRVDLVLLDVVLPGKDGLSIAGSLRADHPNIGIVMLTGRGDPVDRIVGLELGADDYLVKPFHMRELLARVKSVSRRVATPDLPPSASNPRLHFAGWCLDLAARHLISPAGDNVQLTGGEFALLAAFTANANKVLSRDRLLDLVSGREAGPFDRSIDVQVGRLRRKLGDDPRNPTIIKTVRGGGYIFAAVTETAADLGQDLPVAAAD